MAIQLIVSITALIVSLVALYKSLYIEKYKTKTAYELDKLNRLQEFKVKILSIKTSNSLNNILQEIDSEHGGEMYAEYFSEIINNFSTIRELFELNRHLFNATVQIEIEEIFIKFDQLESRRVEISRKLRNNTLDSESLNSDLLESIMNTILKGISLINKSIIEQIDKINAKYIK